MSHHPQSTSDPHSHSHSDAGGHQAIGHVVHPKILFATALGLVVLTVLTVSSARIDFAQLDLPELNVFIALAIAVLKASLVCLFFMHLRWDRPFNAFVLVTALSLVGLFISFAMTDSFEYQHEIIHGESTVIQGKLSEIQTVEQDALKGKTTPAAESHPAH